MCIQRHRDRNRQKQRQWMTECVRQSRNKTDDRMCIDRDRNRDKG